MAGLAEKMGREAALVALDQAHGDIERSLEDYFDNLGDTLVETGMLEHAADARRGFEAVLIERGIACRPMGL